MAGTVDKAKGQAKEKLGKATGDKRTENEGKMDRATGTVKDKANDAADAVRDGIDKLKDKATRG